jgi:hypothetical protein
MQYLQSKPAVVSNRGNASTSHQRKQMFRCAMYNFFIHVDITIFDATQRLINMNQLNQAQERQQAPSTASVSSVSEWYSKTTDTIRDSLCFACPSSDNQVWDDSSYAYDERKEPIRKCFASYELSGEIEDKWIHHKDTLPMQNITRRTHSLLQSNSIFSRGDDDDDDDDVPRAQTLTHSRDNSFASIVFLSSAAVHKPLHPPISPSDTLTTVSLSQSMDDDDDEDWRSTTSTEVVSHLFRPKQNYSSSSKSGGNKDHESYGHLLRMKPEHYMHGGDHVDEMSGLHMHGGDHADEEKSGLQSLRPTYACNDSFIVRSPGRGGNGRCLAAVAA